MYSMCSIQFNIHVMIAYMLQLSVTEFEQNIRSDLILKQRAASLYVIAHKYARTGGDSTTNQRQCDQGQWPEAMLDNSIEKDRIA